jgi:hypothetical protein
VWLELDPHPAIAIAASSIGISVRRIRSPDYPLRP